MRGSWVRGFGWVDPADGKSTMVALAGLDELEGSTQVTSGQSLGEASDSVRRIVIAT